MKSKTAKWIIAGIFVFLGIFILGMLSGVYAISKPMENYDLYNCIWNNAQTNDFNSNPEMIKQIQDECVCFREYNYTNLLEVDCS